MEELKRQGVVRHIGLSSHTPKVAEKVLDMRILDMLMFSINPAYEYQHGEFAIGSGDERASALPALRKRRRGHFSDEGVQWRPAVGRENFPLRPGAE